jgi:diguanylate cyclase (GGDEF)-like protein
MLLRSLQLLRGARWGPAWVREWKFWALPRVVIWYLIGLCTIWLGAVSFGVATTTFSVADLLTFLLLIGCGAVAIEATRRQGEPAGVLAQDMLSAWSLPIAFILPPTYSLIAPIPFMILTQIRVRPTVVHRRAISAVVLGLSGATTSVAFHELRSLWQAHELVPGLSALLWAGAAVACALLGVIANRALVTPPYKATNPEATWGGMLFGRENVVLDWGELCTGVLLGIATALHPVLAAIALTPVILLQRGMLHDQLSAAARLDAKTQLLNAVTWEREAAGEISRAVRTKSTLSVMLLDLDHFKPINDRFGHLAGDDVLRAVAQVLQSQTREYDLCARFGGDEFAILLPHSDVAEAERTAERIRRHVAGIAVPVGPEYVRVSVSVGVAELTSPTQDVTDLLAAADSELYKAKADRPPVPVTTDRRFGDDVGGL